MTFKGHWNPDIFSFRAPDAVSSDTDLGLAWFLEDRGYSEDDAEDIASLQIGQRWISPDYGDHHTVTRIA